MFFNSKKIYREKTSDEAFSLVETIVAVAILAFALVGPLTVAERSLASAAYSRDRIVASFLAEEGIEYVQYVRAQNALENKGVSRWLDGLSSCAATGYCGIDPTASEGGQVVSCNSSNSDCLLYFNCGSKDSNGQCLGSRVYGHQTGSGWVATKFKRNVRIDNIVSNQEIKVTSTVTWRTLPFGTRSLTAADYLLNWRQPIQQ